MQTILLVIHVLIALALIALVLLQHGKGADMGAAFGSGASTTVFGARGAGSFLTRTTAILAALFFATSLALAFLATRNSEVPQANSIVDRIQIPETPAAPPVSGPNTSTLTHKFPLMAQQPMEFPGGREWLVDSARFPISRTMTGIFLSCSGDVW